MQSIQTTVKEPLEVKNKKLLVCGMGGSGISGDYIQQMAEEKGSATVVVNKKYKIPPMTDDSWDAVVISYSGNTEETLSCLYNLIDVGIRPVCITSNGKLMKKAKELNLHFIKIPKDIQPRFAFPYLFGSLYGLVAESLDFTLPSISMENRIIESSKQKDTDEANNIASKLINLFPIIVHPKELSCVATRFRTQLNENSKLAAATYEAPEFSHNAIVAFDGNVGKNQIIVLLRSAYEYQRTKLHLDFIRDNLAEKAADVIEIYVDTETQLEEILSMTWKLDKISIKAAKLQEIDPLVVETIDELKAVLKSE